MVSLFDAEFDAAAAPALSEMFGVAVTYNPLGVAGAETTCVYWREGETLAGYYPDGEHDVRTGVIKFQPGDVTSASRKDTVTINGVVWAVKYIGRLLPVVEFQIELITRVGVGKGHQRED